MKNTNEEKLQYQGPPSPQQSLRNVGLVLPLHVSCTKSTRILSIYYRAFIRKKTNKYLPVQVTDHCNSFIAGLLRQEDIWRLRIGKKTLTMDPLLNDQTGL